MTKGKSAPFSKGDKEKNQQLLVKRDKSASFSENVR